ncbi:carboxymuconolactone decarboxylase family protein [Hymenobacter edaphi]|uniref:Carboxymuconolactone decarboxylase family protein n=1 Tax=Hymenobacter edaphi TaxID=2211146 RepID=A0A328BV57_9BACT|nr:carboxymuconolactone decarboxylase family protein [Hymenobacter edaphi]RAK70499.1 carboxymuconolactone decarboxylase family protein [Hymenobacter edaphi]
MEKRVNIEAALPTVWKAMYNLSISMAKTSLTPVQQELIKVRVSQINGCAFCLDMHSKEALRIGETPQRLLLLNAWRETDLFTAEEKAILAVAEEVTLIHQHGVSDATYQQAAQLFGPEVVAQIIVAAVLINTWNRIAVSTQLPVAKAA